MKLRRPRFRTAAGWSFTRVPGAAQHEVVRCRPGTVSVRGGPGSAMHRFAGARAASHPGHTIPTVIRHSCLTTSNNTHSLVAARFCVNALSPQHALAGSIPVFSCFSADSDLPSPGLTISNNTHSIVPAAHFCARGLQRCFTHPESRGGRSAEKRSGAALSTRWTRHNAACQAPSEAPCVP